MSRPKRVAFEHPRDCAAIADAPDFLAERERHSSLDERTLEQLSRLAVEQQEVGGLDVLQASFRQFRVVGCITFSRFVYPCRGDGVALRPHLSPERSVLHFRRRIELLFSHISNSPANHCPEPKPPRWSFCFPGVIMAAWLRQAVKPLHF